MARRQKNKQQVPPQKDWRNFLLYSLIGVMLFFISSTFLSPNTTIQQIDFSDFKTEIQNGAISEVTINPKDSTLIGTKKSNEKIKTFYLDYPGLISELNEQNIKIRVNPSDSSWFMNLFIQAFLPFLLIAFLWFFIFRQAQGANNQALSFGKSKVKPWAKSDRKPITFKDVAGVNEAVEELQEIVEFLKTPKKFLEIGAKIPKGALLMGPPGTGKTLLAKAIAGEANVPFYSLSGSDFVEMFVGVGASRVRDLFGQAKKNQPSIIFVDEIDAVGRHRGAGLGGGHDEREQTLNQLLVEMDGFDVKDSVIIIAATNRPDILDPALLRPGRFDRQIIVDKPDIKGREDILKIHATGKKIDGEIDMEIIARRTPGFTGADLANLLNESALLAARIGKKNITMNELEEATDRVIAGPERKSRLISTKEKETVAYHEVGHAIVAHACEHADPVHKISILPRGLALGYTLQLPIEDKHLVSKEEIEDQIKILLGGRIAEEIQFNRITSGASNDIERATDLAKSYICKYGMNKSLGHRKYGDSGSQVFLGKELGNSSKDYSEETAHQIDQEIKNLIDFCYNESKKIIKKYRKELDQISISLMESEVMDAESFIKLMPKIIHRKKRSASKTEAKKKSDLGA